MKAVFELCPKDRLEFDNRDKGGKKNSEQRECCVQRPRNLNIHVN